MTVAYRYVPMEISLPADAATFIAAPEEDRELELPTFDHPGGRLARYAPASLGEHRWRAVDDRRRVVGEGSLHVSEYDGSNPLYRSGPLRVRDGGDVLEHADGTASFWLADTWWIGLSDRITDSQFNELLAHRREQGFNSVQLVAGLYPELQLFDERAPLDGRFPWDATFSQPDPDWWAAADRRVRAVVDAGLVPVIYGAWGYHIESAGVDGLVRHWREVVARWAAFPVVWVVAGEARMPHYSVLRTEAAPAASLRQASRWAHVAGEVRRMDGHGRLLTVHPSPGDGSYASRDVFDDPELYDIDWLQTGHQGARAAADTLRTVVRERRETAKPVVVAEACYEGILGSNWQDIQRLAFWLAVLSGAAGYGYGAEGLYGFAEQPWIGDAGAWGELTWPEAVALPGAGQIGLGRRILERLGWNGFVARPDIVDPHADEDDPLAPVAAESGKRRLVYFPSLVHASTMSRYRKIRLTDLGTATWRATLINPRTGSEHSSLDLVPTDGIAELTEPRLSPLPTMDDWLLVMEAL